MYGIQAQRIDVVQKMIAVCSVLHNICIDFGDQVVNDLSLSNGIPEPQPDLDICSQIIPAQQLPFRRNAVDVIVDIFDQRRQQ